MAKLTFTSHFKRYFSSLPEQADGATISEVLETAFLAESDLRGYVLDDQGRLWAHVRILLDDEALSTHLPPVYCLAFAAAD